MVIWLKLTTWPLWLAKVKSPDTLFEYVQPLGRTSRRLVATSTRLVLVTVTVKRSESPAQMFGLEAVFWMPSVITGALHLAGPAASSDRPSKSEPTKVFTE